MRTPIRSLAALVLLNSLALPVQAITPLGGEFLLDPATVDRESDFAQVAVHDDGRFAAVWEQQWTATDTDVYMQLYASTGAPLPNRVTVDRSSLHQRSPRIAARSDGGYVVAYRNHADQLVVRRYNASGFVLTGSAGTADAGSMIVTPTGSGETLADFDIAISSTGQELLVWAVEIGDGGAFRAAGPSGTVTNLLNDSFWQNRTLDLESDESGNFVMASKERTDNASSGQTSWRALVLAISPTPSTQLIGVLPDLGTFNFGDTRVPQVTLAAWGQRRAAVAYSAQSGFANMAYELMYVNAGSESPVLPLGSDLGSVDLDCTATGRCAVLFNPAFSSDLALREFTAGGPVSADPVPVTLSGFRGFVDADHDGDLVVVWTGTRPNDASFTEVRGRRFSGSEPVDLALTQTEVRDPVVAGGRVDYRISVRNLHARQSTLLPPGIGQATNVSVVDTVPAGATFLSGSGTDWTCTHASGVVQCGYSKPLAPQALSSLTLSFNVSGVSGPTLLDNYAYVVADQEDPSQDNNAELEQTSVDCGAATFVFAFSNQTVSENAGFANVSVVRTGGCGSATVQVVSADESASVYDNDYEPVASTLQWAAGEYGSQTVLVQINEDAIDEANEKLRLRLINPVNGTLDNPAESLVTINDNDAAPKLRWLVAQQSVGENADAAVATIKLSMVSGRNVSVTINTSGTASLASDYQLDSTTVVIPAGWTEIQVPIAIDEDAIDESNETAILTLATPVNAGLADHRNVHTVTIVDNDESAPVTVAFTAVAGSLTESQASRNIAVALSGASGQTVTVNYAVTSGTATGGGVDYTLADGTLTFLPGQTSKNLVMTIVNDAIDEGSYETVIVTLSAPTNATLGEILNHSIKILDDD